MLIIFIKNNNKTLLKFLNQLKNHKFTMHAEQFAS
ncbi:MAG: hypothetical protein JWR76_2094 [Mucilaginibacter sp.]|nr:hypothetical protein [Mucilaginibacter sp.]